MLNDYLQVPEGLYSDILGNTCREIIDFDKRIGRLESKMYPHTDEGRHLAKHGKNVKPRCGVDLLNELRELVTLMGDTHSDWRAGRCEELIDELEKR